jgi:hypothetical protein
MRAKKMPAVVGLFHQQLIQPPISPPIRTDWLLVRAWQEPGTSFAKAVTTGCRSSYCHMTPWQVDIGRKHSSLDRFTRQGWDRALREEPKEVLQTPFKAMSKVCDMKGRIPCL